MTKAEIVDNLQNQMAQHYRTAINWGKYKGDKEREEWHVARVWAIYWTGLDLLGDNYAQTLDNARVEARATAERIHAHLDELEK